jgi:hypothetical protein
LFAGAVTLNKFELATNLIFVEFFFVFRISILISLQKLLSRAIRDGLSNGLALLVSLAS